MKLCFLFIVLGLVLTVLNGETVQSVPDTSSEPSIPVVAEEHTLEQLAKLPIKRLRSMFEKRGLDCKGCSEKSEYVSKVFENQNIPEVETPVAEVKGDAIPEGVDQDKLDELMASLKNGGFGNSKMFSADELKNMSPEEMSAKMGGKSKRSSSSGKKSKASKTSKAKKDTKDSSSKEKSSKKGKTSKTKDSKSSNRKNKPAEPKRSKPVPKEQPEEEEDSHIIEL